MFNIFTNSLKMRIKSIILESNEDDLKKIFEILKGEGKTLKESTTNCAKVIILR